MKMKKIILLILIVFVLSGIAISQGNETNKKKVLVSKLEKKTLSKENATIIEKTFANNKIKLGKIKSYQETDNHIILNYDSGWRIFTSKEKFDEITNEKWRT